MRKITGEELEEFLSDKELHWGLGCGGRRAIDLMKLPDKASFCVDNGLWDGSIIVEGDTRYLYVHATEKKVLIDENNRYGLAVSSFYIEDDE